MFSKKEENPNTLVNGKSYTQTELANSLQRLANYENNLLEQVYFFLKQLSHFGKEKNTLLSPENLRNWAETIKNNPGYDCNKDAELQKLKEEIEQLPKDKAALENNQNYYLIGLVSACLISMFVLELPFSTSMLLPMFIMNLYFFSIPTLILPLLTFAICENFFSMMILSAVFTFSLSCAAYIGYNIESNLIDKKLSIFSQKIGGYSISEDSENENNVDHQDIITTNLVDKEFFSIFSQENGCNSTSEDFENKNNLANQYY